MRRRNNKNESGKIKIHNVRKTKGKDIDRKKLDTGKRERAREGQSER